MQDGDLGRVFLRAEPRAEPMNQTLTGEWERAEEGEATMDNLS